MLGIVILNYKNWDITKNCIDSIFKSNLEEEIQIIVVDNGSKNESIPRLMETYADNNKVCLIELDENKGFASANNIGIKKCQELGIQYAVLTNSDIIFRRNTLLLLLKCIKDKKDAVIIGPGVVSDKGERMPSSMLSPVRLLDAFEIGRFVKQDRIDEDAMKDCTEVFSVSGCCFIVDIEKFCAIGAFDNRTFLYNEENILGIQVKNSEYNTYIYPKAEVIHLHGASSGRRNTFTQTEYIKSNIYYWKQYRGINPVLLFGIIVIYFIKMCILKMSNPELHPMKILEGAIDEYRKLYQR